MAWGDIDETETDPFAPLKSSLFKRLANNVAAVANGDSGAPRVTDAALSTSVTGAGRSWVAQRIVTAAWNAVGQTVLCRTGVGGYGPGDTTSGANLVPATAAGSSASAALPGTWRLQGEIGLATNAESTSLYLRVS